MNDLNKCKECNQPNDEGWCYSCNKKHFIQDFNKWTSGNEEINKFIRECQLNATHRQKVLEWIPYEKFDEINDLARGGFGIVRRAVWTDGYIWEWNIDKNEWLRTKNANVVLKCLKNSQDLTTDFLHEVCSFLFVIFLVYYSIYYSMC